MIDMPSALFPFWDNRSRETGVEWHVGSNPGMVSNLVDAYAAVGVDLEHASNEIGCHGAHALGDGVDSC